MSFRASFEARIAAWFLDRLNVDVRSPATDLIETAILDSLALVELMAHLEREFGVTLAPEDIDVDNFRSIERIVAFVLNAESAAPDGPRAEAGRLAEAC